MLDNLKNYHVLLASNSPRRRELLAGLGIDFEVCVLPDIEENYPPELPVSEIAQYIAREKAEWNKTIKNYTKDSFEFERIGKYNRAVFRFNNLEK